jgi:hypothetical protein
MKPFSTVFIITILSLIASPAQARMVSDSRQYLPGTSIPSSTVRKAAGSSLSRTPSYNSSITPDYTITSSTSVPAPFSSTPYLNKINVDLTPSACLTDKGLDSYAKQRVNTAANAVQNNLTWKEGDTFADQIKKGIENTHYGTGGHIRDIYTNEDSQSSRKQEIEDYIRSFYSSESLERSAQQKADSLNISIKSNISQLYSPKDNEQGSGSSSHSIRPYQSTTVRSGGFDLKQRQALVFFNKVGRFNYTITSKTQVSVDNLHFSEQYNTCDKNPQPDGQFSYGAIVKVTPMVEIRYTITPDNKFNGGSISGIVLVPEQGQTPAENDLQIDGNLF